MPLKTFLSIAALFIIIAGAGCAATPSTPTPTPEPTMDESADQAPEDTTQETVTILFTNEGYIPSSVTIAAGMSVTFVNASKQDMWPASAVHPTHRDYPTTGGCLGSTFDACARIKPGQSWSFTFEEPGAWKFHDHLNPTFFGTVVVE